MVNTNTLPCFAVVAYLCAVNAFTVRIHRQGDHYSTQLGATWSNGQAVRDYQNFLSSGKQEIELTADCPSVILKPFESSTPLAEVLVAMGIGGDDMVLTPDQDLPQSLGGRSEFPIYITLPPSQIGDFLTNLPESYKTRLDDFVFFAGGLEYGNIEDILKERGYCRDTMTQVLISGMRISKNNKVQDMKAFLGLNTHGEDKIAGECTACGKWAGSIAARLERSNVFCRTEFYREWRRKMWERSVYDAAFHLIGAIRDEPTSLSDVAHYYADEVSDIVWEMSQLLRGWRAVTLTYSFEERLLGMGESSGAGMHCTLIEEMYPFIWGNPVFLEGKAFVEYLQYAKEEKGMLQDIDLPQRCDADYTSHMRQGNLRADGVV